jgi:hypothetical protein
MELFTSTSDNSSQHIDTDSRYESSGKSQHKNVTVGAYGIDWIFEEEQFDIVIDVEECRLENSRIEQQREWAEQNKVKEYNIQKETQQQEQAEEQQEQEEPGLFIEPFQKNDVLDLYWIEIEFGLRKL